MKTDRETLVSADWEKLEQDVVTAIRLLALTAKGLDDSPLSDKICNDLILPNLALLAEFCGNVVQDPDEPSNAG